MEKNITEQRVEKKLILGKKSVEFEGDFLGREVGEYLLNAIVWFFTDQLQKDEKQFCEDLINNLERAIEHFKEELK